MKRWQDTRLHALFGTQLPIVQAGMAGGPTTPELVAAVSNAGALGTLGAGYMRPEAIERAIHEIRAKTDRPFAVNLFIPERFSVSCGEIQVMQSQLEIYWRTLGASPVEPVLESISFTDQVDVLIAERVPIFSFTFGIPNATTIDLLQEAGIVLVGTATTVEEAIRLQDAGVDAVVCQGSEAGGHRGTFSVPFERGLIGTMSLVPQVVDAIELPVIASGGIADGRGAVAAFALGACGVQIGTAFLTATESGAHPAYKTAVSSAKAEDTVLTAGFSGKLARGLANDFTRMFAAADVCPLPYPIQNQLTKPLRQLAQHRGDTDFMSLWAGQSARMSRQLPAAEIVQLLCAEIDCVFNRM